MDFGATAKEWQAYGKDIAKVHPRDTDLMAEIESVSGALQKLDNIWAKVPDLDALRKNIGALIGLGATASKEIASYQAVAKKRDKLANAKIGDTTDKELDDFIKAADAFKKALEKFPP